MNPDEARMLIQKAWETLPRAYAPYSRFHVAAALPPEEIYTLDREPRRLSQQDAPAGRASAPCAVCLPFRRDGSVPLPGRDDRPAFQQASISASRASTRPRQPGRLG